MNEGNNSSTIVTRHAQKAAGLHEVISTKNVHMDRIVLIFFHNAFRVDEVFIRETLALAAMTKIICSKYISIGGYLIRARVFCFL